MKKASFFRLYLLPGIIFQSVLIGGGYATGREVVEFGARFGSLGIWSILVIFLGFSVIAGLTYEVARIFRVFDYKSWIKELIFPLWPVFDVLFVVMTILVLGVLSAATGSMVEEVLGWPFWVGAGMVLALVAGLNFYGDTVIANFKTGGTLFLYAGYLAFSWAVLSHGWPRVTEVLSSGDSSFADDAGIGTAVWSGLLYVGYNLAVLPSTLFVLKEQKRRRHSLGAGLVTGVLATVPFTLTWFSLLAHYPDAEVLDAPVPWIRMLTAAASPAVLVLYGVVVIWTLVETCTGFIHALLDRVDVGLQELGLRHLSAFQKSLLSALVLLLAGGLSRFGIIDLIARGYTMLAYGFLLFLALPLLTVGIYRLSRESRNESHNQT